MVFKLFANCIPVKGAKKSIVMDLQRKSYLNIPNDLYDILTVYRDKSIKEIKSSYNHNFDKTIDEYFSVLKLNELGFETDCPENFPDLKVQWKSPFPITNALIDISNESQYDLNELLNQISSINCKFVQLRFYDQISTNRITEVLNLFDTNKLNILSIDLILPFHERINDGYCMELYKNYPRLTNLIIYSSPYGNSIKHPSSNSNYIHSKDNLRPDCACGAINKRFFSINIKNYCESLEFNSCLNGKVSIDIHGNIKNCPSMQKKYGNISDKSLNSLFDNKDFSGLWKIKKDNIKVCKDCEFRYCCTDCRAFLEDPEDIHSKPLKCGYNPYTGTWSDWKVGEMKMKGIKFYQLTDLLNV